MTDDMTDDGDMGLDPSLDAGAGGSSATISWAGNTLQVDCGDGPKPAESIGEALALVLDAYRGAKAGGPERAGYGRAFAQQDRPGREPQARPTMDAYRDR